MFYRGRRTAVRLQGETKTFTMETSYYILLFVRQLHLNHAVTSNRNHCDGEKMSRVKLALDTEVPDL